MTQLATRPIKVIQYTFNRSITKTPPKLTVSVDGEALPEGDFEMPLSIPELKLARDGLRACVSILTTLRASFIGGADLATAGRLRTISEQIENEIRAVERRIP